jgi:hypothetical protein
MAEPKVPENGRGRARRGRPRSDDGLLEMLLMMALDKNLKPWPAALEAAGFLTNNGDYRESLAKGLTRKLRKIKKRYESRAVQDLLDDDMAYLVSEISEDRGWLGTLIIQESSLDEALSCRIRCSSGCMGPILLPYDSRFGPTYYALPLRKLGRMCLSRDEAIRLIVQNTPRLNTKRFA